MAVFVSISDAKMAALIDSAGHRVLLAVPAFRSRTAEALQRAIERLGRKSVTAIVDCSDHVFRLGLGDLASIIRAREAGCAVRQAAGLRLGVLVVDGNGWAFAPTALYVSQEVHSDETPNAVRLAPDAVNALVAAMADPTSASAGDPPAATPGQASNDSNPETVPVTRASRTEVGVALLTQAEVDAARESLAEAPPLSFDVARQVRVFESYIQYVEISLRGCAIQRRRLEIPRTIQGLGRKQEIGRRLRTTFEVIHRESELSSKSLEGELKQIRDDFTRSLGEPWGRVLLRAKRAAFDEKIGAFRKRLTAHRTSVAEALEKHLEESRKELVEYFLPIALESPPSALDGQVVGEPTAEQAERWLDIELQRVFPRATDLVSEMKLDVQYRDVTYETLNESEFAARLRAAYPHVDWDRPFDEFDAARTREEAPAAPT